MKKFLYIIPVKYHVLLFKGIEPLQVKVIHPTSLLVQI